MSAINRMKLLDAEASQFGVSTEKFVRQLNGTKICIDGIKASKMDLLDLERKLKSGVARAYGRCYNGTINFQTRG